MGYVPGPPASTVNVYFTRETVNFRKAILAGNKDLTVDLIFSGGSLAGTLYAPDGFWFRDDKGNLVKSLVISELDAILDDNGNAILDDSNFELQAD